MKLVTFGDHSRERVGVLLADGTIIDLMVAANTLGMCASHFGSMLELIRGGSEASDLAACAAEKCPESALHAAGSVSLLAPLPRPPRLRDALMFLAHMEHGLSKWARGIADNHAEPDAEFERLMATGRYTLDPVFRQRVIYYNADHLSVSGPDMTIEWPSGSDYADFELEWAVVIGHARRGMNAEEARSAVFGYTIYNDWSARDLQLEFMKANLGPAEGKDFSLSNSLGPCIVTADEIRNPYQLEMQARVNGVTWCTGSTASMYHRFERAIVQFSRYEDLCPGEIIGSGTVLNGCGFELGRRLHTGDVVELEVDGIGVLRNYVKMQ
jgi:2-keto-4-pentenoate hydratase/2-oxohepta-3-ene-1,7-dioic acid hydratase in catechol pathway